MKMKPILFNTDMVRAIQNGTKMVTRRVVKPQPRSRYSLAQMPIGPHKGEWHEYNESSLKDPTITSPWGYQFTPPYHPGDILYVRETWRVQSARRFDADVRIMFKAGGDMVRIQFPGAGDQYHSRARYDLFVNKWADDRWHPSIHMPREAARIFLWVADVRVERLQDFFCRHGSTILLLQREGIDIGEQCRDCIKAYGSPCCSDDDSECGVLDEVRGEFSDLWDSTIKPAGRDLYGWAANPWVWAITFERISRDGAEQIIMKEAQ